MDRAFLVQFDELRVSSVSSGGPSFTRSISKWLIPSKGVHKLGEWSTIYASQITALICFFCLAGMYPLEPTLQSTKLKRVYAHLIPDNYTLKEYNDYVQGRQVKWTMYQQLSFVPTSMVFGTLLGAWSDRFGRQYNVLLGHVAINIIVFQLLIIFSQTLDGPLYWIVLCKVIEGCLGGLAGFIGGHISYINDIVKKDRKQTIAWRITTFSVAMSVGSTLGAASTGIITKHLHWTTWICTLQYLLLASFVFTLLRMVHVPPKIMHEIRSHGEQTAVLVHIADNDGSKDDDKDKGILAGVLSLYADVFHTFIRPRPGSQRLWVSLLVFIFFVLGQEFIEQLSLLGIYTKYPPLNWGVSKFATWNAVSGLIGIVGTLGGLYLFKQVLKLPDTAIMLIALTSESLAFIPYAFAYADWMMYLGAALKILSGLADPAAKSFAASFLPVQEMGKFMTLAAIVINLSFFGSQLVFQPIYIATLAWFKGFVFLVLFGLSVLTIGITIFLHLSAIVQQNYETVENGDIKGNDTLEKCDSEDEYETLQHCDTEGYETLVSSDTWKQ